MYYAGHRVLSEDFFPGSYDFYIPISSSYYENIVCFGVWLKHSYLNFFEGGLLCLKN